MAQRLKEPYILRAIIGVIAHPLSRCLRTISVFVGRVLSITLSPCPRLRLIDYFRIGCNPVLKPPRIKFGATEIHNFPSRLEMWDLFVAS